MDYPRTCYYIHVQVVSSCPESGCTPASHVVQAAGPYHAAFGAPVPKEVTIEVQVDEIYELSVLHFHHLVTQGALIPPALDAAVGLEVIRVWLVRWSSIALNINFQIQTHQADILETLGAYEV